MAAIMPGSQIRLPAPAWRRTYFVKLMRQGGPFEQLLRLLSPQRWAEAQREPNFNAMTMYWALWEHLETLFPVREFRFEDDAYDMAWEDADQHGFGEETPEFEAYMEDHLVFLAEDYGIPIDFQGIDGWEPRYNQKFSPALAVAIAAFDEVTSEARREWPEALKPYQDLLRPIFRAGAFGPRKRHKVTLPAGRDWRSPWQALPDLVSYCWSETGYILLDVSNGELDEPIWWHFDAINNLAEQWRAVKPMLAAIERLQKYVEAKPAERLPLFARAVIGEKAALAQITRPAARQPTPPNRTLVEVFAAEGAGA